MIRQGVKAAEIAANHFQADVITDRQHVEVHQRPDLILVVRQGRLQTIALLCIQAIHQLAHDVARQVRCQVRQFVRIQAVGGGDQLMAVHVGDQRFTHRIRHFQQNLAVALGLDQLPDRQTLLQRQRLQHIGYVGRMQLIELALQLDQVLLMHQMLDQLLVLSILLVHQILDQAVALQQLLHLLETILQAFR